MMDRVSIFDSVTLLRGAEPDEIIGLISEFNERDGVPHQYKKKEFKTLYEATRRLPPLVLSSTNKYLICIGKNESVAAYSNFIFGSAADLIGPSAGKLGCDGFLAFWHNYELARDLDPNIIEKDPQFYFSLELRLVRKGNRERAINCIVRDNGDLYSSNWGELFPFENPQDYAHLTDGGWPGMHILEGFCGLFGWPPPTSPEYPKFITSCILYEFPPSPDFPLKPVNKKLEETALRWPWEKPRKRFGLFGSGER